MIACWRHGIIAGMKRTLLFVVVGITVAAAIAGYVGQRPHDVSAPPAHNALLTVLAGQTWIKNPNNQDFTLVSETAEVAAGSQIKTSASGKATLTYPDGTQTLIEENSLIEIQALDQNGAQSRIKIVTGGIWAKVRTLLGSGDYYDVETDNVVASVRGTLFRAQYRDRITTLYGIEHAVRVRARTPDTGTDIPGTDADLKAGEKAIVRSDALPATGKVIVMQLMSAADFRGTALREHAMDIMEKGDLDDTDGRAFVQKMREYNITDRPFIQRMIERQLISPVPTPSPSASASVTPSIAPTIKPSATILPTSSTTPSVTPLPTLQPSPTPVPHPTLQSVVPSSVAVGQEVAINGSNFTTGRNVSQIAGVAIGGMPVTFTVLDSLTIFATIDAQFKPGTYDIVVTDTAGGRASLQNAITVQ